MTSDPAVSRLIGVWRLEAIRDRLPDGQVAVHPDFGPDVDGLLIYTATGYVSVQFMRRGRTEWRGEWPTDAEREEAARGYGAYAGRFEADEGAGVVRHHVETALIPNRVGATLERSFSLEGDRLTLSPPALTRNGVRVERRLVWRRVA
jgi:lipocalin-like protein